MKLHLLYFASLREAVGTAREELEVPDGVRTVDELRVWLCGRGGAWAQALAAPRNVRAAMNQRMAEPGQVLVDGAELAFFPPVTGG